MSLLDQLNASLGASDDASDTIPYWLPTPLPNLNAVISDRMDKGFPGGRITLISGLPSTGKTALASAVMVAAQRHPDGFASYLDHEHAFQLEHAVRQGLDKGRFYYKQPMSAEEGFDAMYGILRMVRALNIGFDVAQLDKEGGHLKLLQAIKKHGVEKLPPLVQVIDSIASMVTAEQDIAYDKQNMKTKNMSLAMFLSMELKRAIRDVNIGGSTLIMLNQLRTNPGIMFGDSTTEPGGSAPEFYASVRLRLRKAGKVYASWDDKATEQVGDVVEVFTAKNKVARPFRKTKYVFRTADPVGLDLVQTMVLLGKEAGTLGAVSGKTMDFGGKSRWNIDAFTAEARTNPALVADLVRHVMPVILPSLTAEHAPGEAMAAA